MLRIVKDWRIAAIPGNEIVVIGKDPCKNKVRSLAIKKILPDFILEDIEGVKYQLEEQSYGFWKRPFKLLRSEWYERFIEHHIIIEATV